MNPYRLLTTILLCAACACAGEIDPIDDAPGGAGGKADDAAAVTQPLGAMPYAGGTRFRVWAPNAEAAFVQGDFNAWSETANPMTLEPGGLWFADIPGAKAGDEYIYVLRHGGQTLFKQDPRSRDVTSSIGNSVIVDPNAYAWRTSGYRTPPWNEQVIYELHVGSFNDQPGGAPGTFASARQKLDYLADLGVNMIEVLPIAEFPGDFSWGYNGAFPFAPESAYGSPDDVRRFVDEAHARGIGVIVDVVHNHWGPSDLPMWCFDGECLGAGGVYFYTDWRRESGWGPRPDYGRLEVRDFIADSALQWLYDYRADGLRWDSTVNIRQANGSDLPDGWGLLQRVNDAVDATQPWKIMIAEDLQGNDWIGKRTSQGGAGFDSQWDAGFFHPVDDAVITANDADRHMWAVRDAITHTYNAQATQRVIYTESHDEVANGKQRIPEMIWPGHADSWYSRKRSTLGAAITLTSPGIPMLFQGQEILEDGWFQDTDPVDWSKADRFAGILAMYKDLIHLRRNGSNTTRGLSGNNVNVFHVNDTDKVIAYHRWDSGGAGDDVIVLANFGNRAYASYEIGLPRGGTWKVRFNSDWNGYSADFANTASLDTTAYSGAKDGLSYHGSVGLGPYSVVILSQ